MPYLCPECPLWSFPLSVERSECVPRLVQPLHPLLGFSVSLVAIGADEPWRFLGPVPAVHTSSLSFPSARLFFPVWGMPAAVGPLVHHNWQACMQATEGATLYQPSFPLPSQEPSQGKNPIDINFHPDKKGRMPSCYTKAKHGANKSIRKRLYEFQLYSVQFIARTQLSELVQMT